MVAGTSSPRVCLCVLMNHPFPQNLPLLRRIYAGRFSELLFLIPFERLPDADVVTVYRGSYVHAAYITDALPRLRQVDCDYFMFVHDDVLLNPQLDETNFARLFPLGPDDGFIPWVHATPHHLGDWIWYYALLPKLLQPKSLLFGSGIEPATVLSHLPDADTIRAGFERSAAPFTEIVSLAPREGTAPNPDTAAAMAAATLLDGLAARHDPAEAVQAAIEAGSRDTIEALTALLRAAAQRDGAATDDGALQLPIPLAASAYYTDCYVVPRSRLVPFAHYVGVAAAAGLFVEIIVPVLLHAVCARVHSAAALNLDFAGFSTARRLIHFRDERAIALHPFKLSGLRDDDRQDAFLAIVAALRSGAALTPGQARAAGLDPSQVDLPRFLGWHEGEAWGRWSAEATAWIGLDGPGAGGRIRLTLTAPTSRQAQLDGHVRINGAAPIVVCLAGGGADAVVEVTGLDPAVALRIEVASSRLIRPRDEDGGSPDRRLLGIGLRSLELY